MSGTPNSTFLDPLLSVKVEGDGAPTTQTGILNFVGLDVAYNPTTKKTDITNTGGAAPIAVADLAALRAVSSLTDSQTAAVASPISTFVYNATRGAGQPDDGAYCIKPDSVDIGASGRWFNIGVAVFDARHFGLHGDGIHDDTAPINAATLAASEAGGGQVLVSGNCIVTAQINLYDKVSLVGHDGGGTKIIDGVPGNYAAAYPNQAIVYGSGSYLTLDALATDAVLGDVTITLATDQSAQLAPGDYFFLYNPADYSFSSERPYYRDGEMCRVLSLAGPMITLVSPIRRPIHRVSHSFTADATTNILTCADHGLATTVADPAETTPERVTLTTTGTLPGGLSLATQYYPVKEYTAVYTVNTSTDVFTSTGHFLSNGDPVKVSADTGGTLAGGLADGIVYWVVNVSGSTFKLSATKGGAAIDIGPGAGTGTQRFHRALALPRGTFYLSATAGGAPIDISGAGTGVHTFHKTEQVKAHKHLGISTSVRNITLVNHSTNHLTGSIRVFRHQECNFDSLVFEGSDYFGLDYSMGVATSWSNIRFFSKTPATGYQFGVIGNNVQDVNGRDSDITSSRIACDFGGGDYIGAIPNANCDVFNCRLKTNRIGGVFAANMHGCSDGVHYRQCTSEGVYFSGNNGSFENGILYSGDLEGEAVYTTECTGFDFSLRGTRIVAQQTVLSDFGMIAMLGTNKIEIPGGTFCIDDVTFDMGPFSGKIIRMQQDGGSVYDINLSMRRLRAKWTKFAGDNEILIFCGEGKAFRTIDMRDIDLDGGYVNLSACSPETLFVRGYKCVNSPSAGFAKSPNATAVWTREDIDVDLNVTRAAATGAILLGQDQTFSKIKVSGRLVDNVQGTPAGNGTDSSLYLGTFLRVKTDVASGDGQTVQTQAYRFGGNNVTDWEDKNPDQEGVPLPDTLSSVFMFRNRSEYVGLQTFPVTGSALENPTDATSGVKNQYSPAHLFRGRAWDSVAVASKTVDFYMQCATADAAGPPTGTLVISASIDGGSLNPIFTIGSGGSYTFGSLRVTPYPGSPEGNVVGSPGDLAVDYTNRKVYIKDTGTGNTGWIVVGP